MIESGLQTQDDQVRAGLHQNIGGHTHKKRAEPMYLCPMEFRKSKMGSVLTHQCPNCHSASIFLNPAIYTLERLGETHAHCPVCGTNLKPEPGFYYGSMYVAWALIVALWVAVLITLEVLDAIGLIEFGFLTHPLTFLLTGITLNTLSFPYIFRVSRSIWAHMFIKRESEKENN